jgi:hypothetical protein
VKIKETISHGGDLIEKRPHNEVVPLLRANLEKVKECDFLTLKRVLFPLILLHPNRRPKNERGR